MTVLLLAETRNTLDGRATRAAVAAARALGPVDLLVCGTAETASAATAWPGLATVLHCADPACAQGAWRSRWRPCWPRWLRATSIWWPRPRRRVPA